MTAQLIVLGTRRPDSDTAYEAYVGVAGPLLFGAGGVPSGQYKRVSHIVGEDGPEQILVMEFPDEDTIRAVFDSPEYSAAIPDRDAAFEHLSVIVAASGA